MSDKEDENEDSISNKVEAWSSRKMDRRRALGKAAKVGIGAAAVIIVGGGVAAWYATQPPPTPLTTTVEKTVEKTVERTVATTSTVPTTVERTVSTTTTIPTTVERTVATTTTIPTTTTVERTVATTTTVPAERPKITVWQRSVFVPSMNDWLARKCLEWGEKAGYRVEVVTMPYGEIYPKTVAALEAGRPPDIVALMSGQVVFAEAGVLLQVDDVWDKLGKDDIYPIVTQTSQIGGHFYWVCNEVHLSPLHLRKDLFKEKGLSVEIGSYEQLADTAKALTGYKTPYGFGLPLGTKCFDTAWSFFQFWYGNGGEVFKGLKPEDVIVDTPAIYKTIDWYRDLWESGVIPKDSPTWTDVGNNLSYVNEESAMIMNPASVYYAAMVNKPELAAKTYVAPESANPCNFTHICNYAFKASKYPDACKDLLYYIMADKADYRRGYIETGYLFSLPIFKSQMEVISKAYQGKTAWTYWGVDPKIYLDKAKASVWAPPPLNQATSVLDHMYDALELSDFVQRFVLSPRADVEKIVAEFKSTIQEKMRKAYGG